MRRRGFLIHPAQALQIHPESGYIGIVSHQVSIFQVYRIDCPGGLRGIGQAIQIGEHALFVRYGDVDAVQLAISSLLQHSNDLFFKKLWVYRVEIVLPFQAAIPQSLAVNLRAIGYAPPASQSNPGGNNAYLRPPPNWRRAEQAGGRNPEKSRSLPGCRVHAPPHRQPGQPGPGTSPGDDRHANSTSPPATFFPP